MATIWGKSASFEVLNDSNEPTTGHGFGGVILYASGTTAAANLYFRSGDGTKEKILTDAEITGSTATINSITAGVVSASVGKFNNLTFKDVDAVHYSGSVATIKHITSTGVVSGALSTFVTSKAQVLSASHGKFNHITSTGVVSGALSTFVTSKAQVVSASHGKFKHITFTGVLQGNSEIKTDGNLSGSSATINSITSAVVSASVGKFNNLTFKDVDAVHLSSSIATINALTVKDVNAVAVDAATITATTTLSGTAITGLHATLRNVTSAGTISGSIINALTVSGALGKFEGTVSASIGQINALTVKDVDAVNIATGVVSASIGQINHLTVKDVNAVDVNAPTISATTTLSGTTIQGLHSTIRNITSAGTISGSIINALTISGALGKFEGTVSASIGQINALTVKDVNAVHLSSSIATINNITVAGVVSGTTGKFALNQATKLIVLNIAADELLVGGAAGHVTGAATLKFKDDSGASTDGLTIGAANRGRNLNAYGENRSSDTTATGLQYMRWNAPNSTLYVSGTLVLESSMASGSGPKGGVGTALVWANSNAQYGFNADDRASISMCSKTNLSSSNGALVAQTLVISGSKGLSVVGANNEDGYLLELPNDRDARARSWATYSSIRLKRDVTTIDNPIDKIKSMRGVKYRWKNSNVSDIGFIAEEMATVVPEVVKTNAKGYATSIDYGRITSYLVEAIKAQQKQIEDLKETVTKLKK